MLLKHNILGIDSTAAKLRLVQLSESGELLAYGSKQISDGVIVDGTIADHTSFVRTVRTALAETTPHPVNDPFARPRASIGLPPALVWSHTAELPPHLPDSEIAQYISNDAANWLPVDTSALASDHIVINAHGTKYATFAGALRDNVRAYQEAFVGAGIQVERISNSLFAVARAVLPREFGDENFLIIDLGTSESNISVFDEHAIPYMTIQSIAVPLQKQEQSLPTLCDDVNRLRSHFESDTGERITRIIVVGRHRDTEKLAENLKEIFDVPLECGDPLRHVSNRELLEEATEAMPYAYAIGLALSAVDPALPHLDFQTTVSSHRRFWVTPLSEKLQHFIQQQLRHIQWGTKSAPKWVFVSVVFFFVAAIVFFIMVVFMYWS